MILDIKEIAGKHSEDDIYTMLRDCNMDPNETAQKLLYIDTFHEVKKKRGKNMGGRFEENRWTGGINRRGGRVGYSSTVNGVNNRTQKGFNKPPMPVLPKTENGATPQPPISPAVASDGPVNIVPEGSGHRAVAKQSAGAVGVKREHVNKNIAAESNATGVEGSKSTIGQDAAKASLASSVAVNSTSRESSVKSNGVAESEKSFSPSENASQIISTKPVTQSPQPSDVPKVVAAEPSTQSVVTNDSVSKEASPELIEKSTQQSVIFPQHLHVPEPYKSQLTFGSLDSVFNPKESVPIIESLHTNTEAPKEPSLSSETLSAATPDDNLSEIQQNLPHVPESNPKTIEENNASLGPPSHWIPPLIVPPLIPSHLVQIEEQEPETQSGAKSPGQTTAASTPTGAQVAAQSSITVTAPPHLFPYFQHPYPPNYFPYNPYFPHVIFSQNGHHQFLGHNGFPQQPSTGNVYMPPPTTAASAAATPAGKLAVPPQYKLGPTPAGNLTTHLGIPYATYGGVGSAVGYNPNVPAVISGSSASTEDTAASDLKEKSNHSAVPQQGEDSRAWSPVPGREIPNYYFNLPHGQHVTFSPAQGGHGPFSGLYHPSQATVTPPAVRSLIHQSHATAGPMDSGVPPPGPYQHPRIAQVNWNTTILNRENM
jgi:hypothetical protein